MKRACKMANTYENHHKRVPSNTIENLNYYEMKITKEYFLFGGRGDVWSETAHIAKAGFHSTTLCGKPMLSSNWVSAEGITEPGCGKCIELYKHQNPES